MPSLKNTEGRKYFLAKHFYSCRHLALVLIKKKNKVELGLQNQKIILHFLFSAEAILLADAKHRVYKLSEDIMLQHQVV